MIIGMLEVNLSAVDLNLLPALEALLRRRNVTQAAGDVGLSQPAMSRALGRLRAVLGDPLLVRTGAGFVLTPRAAALVPRLAGVMAEVKGLFREPGFDPSAERRLFRVAATDTHTVLLAPAIMARLAQEAPGVDVSMEPYSPDMARRMERGDLDLAFAVANAPLPPGAMSEPLSRDRLAVVMRRGHPAARRAFTTADYGVFDHVGIAILGDGQSELDAWLAGEGVRRRMALVTPHFMAALAVVAATDLVTTLSRAFAQRFASEFDLILNEPPFAQGDLQMTLVWSHLRAADPVLTWFRGLVRDVALEAAGQGAA
jgi:DNA-binding transcriptional LysR family regulator